jgi:hypothetical protein
VTRADIAAEDALELVRIVREDQQSIYRHLATLPRERLVAMAVALAAGIDPDATTFDLWGWTEDLPSVRHRSKGRAIYRRGAA